jgi:ribosomal protein L37E
MKRKIIFWFTCPECNARVGVFCPRCGEPAYKTNTYSPQFFCYECGWQNKPKSTLREIIDIKKYQELLEKGIITKNRK